jgi:hypothetical protein
MLGGRLDLVVQLLSVLENTVDQEAGFTGQIVELAAVA